MRFARLSSWALLAASVFSTAGVQAQIVVYEQTSGTPDGLYADGEEGQWSSTRTADNFVLTDPDYRTLTEITWYGASDIDYVYPQDFPAWVVIIYEDDGGSPGAQIYWAEIDVDDIQFTATGEYTMNDAPEYRQTAPLPAKITLFIDQPYWISIGAIVLDPDWDAWLWSVHYPDASTDGICAQDYFDGQGYQTISDETAFSLTAEFSTGCPHAGFAGRGCTADIDGSGDCQVTLSDLAFLLGYYGLCPEDPGYNPIANISLDPDPCINLNDLAEMLGQYGDSCE